MKVLIINDFLVQGGAEVQAKDEFEVLKENGHEAFLVTFDSKYKTGFVSERFYNIKRANGYAGKFFNKFFINPRTYFKLKKIIKTISPDIVHLHNNLKMSKTVNALIKKYKCVQTFHDYGVICPKGTCVLDDGSECDGYFCAEKCDCLSFPRSIVKKAELKRNKKFIDKYVKRGFTPSENLSLKMSNNRYLNVEPVPNIIDLKKEMLYNFETKNGFCFCGVVSREKGIDVLIKAFSSVEFADKKLFIIGGISPSFEKDFYEMIQGKNNIEYLGRLPREQVFEIYGKCICTIIPSLWLENYPNVVMESLLCGTLCAGSNRGGIPELLGNNLDLLFEPTDAENLKKSILYVCSLREDAYCRLVDKLSAHIVEYNSKENFYENLMRLLVEI